nr:PREDICTED: inositol 1,4,5-trisphosphate receptor-interacting protein-like 1 [Opisthocomus hoazin]
MAKFFAGLFHQALVVGESLDEATHERMQHRDRYLSRKMIQMLQELQQQEQRIQLRRIQALQMIQEQSGFAWGALLCAALQQWQFWVIAAVLVLLCGLYWWLRRRSRQASSSKHSGSRSLEEEEEKDPFHRDRWVDNYTPWQLLNRKTACRVVEDLANELLRVCQKLSNKDFMPRLQAPVGLGSFQVMDPQGDKHYVYRLLVPLEPPPGHSFHLELSTEGEMPVRNSRLRVQLECTCSEDQQPGDYWQPGDMLCFLHHSEDLLMNTQEASLLQTLCIGPYLDVQKTAFRLRVLMKTACTLVPHRDIYELTVLPSTHYCRIKMTSIFEKSRSIELVLGVQHGDSDTFVCLE